MENIAQIQTIVCKYIFRLDAIVWYCARLKLVPPGGTVTRDNFLICSKERSNVNRLWRKAKFHSWTACICLMKI